MIRPLTQTDVRAMRAEGRAILCTEARKCGSTWVANALEFGGTLLGFIPRRDDSIEVVVELEQSIRHRGREIADRIRTPPAGLNELTAEEWLRVLEVTNRIDRYLARRERKADYLDAETARAMCPHPSGTVGIGPWDRDSEAFPVHCYACGAKGRKSRVGIIAWGTP